MAGLSDTSIHEIIDRCLTCKKWYSRVLFTKDKIKPKGVTSRCKYCTNRYHKKWRDENKEHVRSFRKTWRENNREKFSDYQRQYLYGMAKTEFDALLERQNGICAICQDKYHRTLSVDHNHLTGRTRGLLCDRCNIAIGNFEENIEYMQTAMAYLSRYSS